MTNSHSVEVVVLAAGQGTRMRSKTPKVLHALAGKPMLAHVLDTAASLNPSRCHVVVGHGADLIRNAFDGNSIHFVTQSEQLGTGHAVSQAMPDVIDDAVVLVLYGDVPLVSEATLKACVAAASEGGVGLVTALFDDPAQLGRIVREDGVIKRIVEFKDATDAERAIREINSGIMAAPASVMKALLANVQPNNAQGEYYLTDIIEMAVTQNLPVTGLLAATPAEVTGVNDRAQLAELERIIQQRYASKLMANGVTLADPARIDVRGSLTAGRDSQIDVNAVFIGEVVLGEDVRIGPNCTLINSVLGDGVVVEANTVIEGASIAKGCTLGPFARIRPGTELAEGVRIGNFVETKKSKLGKGSKANHLAYLGDATIGAGCNVGAGTITCNYDGVNKYPTHIGDNVFVGTNSTLVAPLEIESDAYVAAGSTITSKVKAKDLAVGRARQRNIEGWKRPSDR